MLPILQTLLWSTSIGTISTRRLEPGECDILSSQKDGISPWRRSLSACHSRRQFRNRDPLAFIAKRPGGKDGHGGLVCVHRLRGRDSMPPLPSPSPPLSFFIGLATSCCRSSASHAISTAVYIRHVLPTSFQRPLSDKVLVPLLKPTLPPCHHPLAPSTCTRYLRLWLITHSSLQTNPRRAQQQQSTFVPLPRVQTHANGTLSCHATSHESPLAAII